MSPEAEPLKEAEHLLRWVVAMINEQRAHIGDIPDVRILQAGARAWLDRFVEVSGSTEGASE